MQDALQQEVFESFQENTAKHELTILKDDGKYRHIRFGVKGSSFYAINITTWPGYLAVTGDMGDFVFTRLSDMFEFFRGKSGINPGYWGEKLVAEPRGSEYGKKWSEEAFKRDVNNYLENNLEPLEDLDGEEAETNNAIREEIEESLKFISHKEEADDFIANFDEHDFQFDSFYEYDNTEYTHHFLWICYAIVEVIKLYDATKTEQNAA